MPRRIVIQGLGATSSCIPAALALPCDPTQQSCAPTCEDLVAAKNVFGDQIKPEWQLWLEGNWLKVAGVATLGFVAWLSQNGKWRR